MLPLELESPKCPFHRDDEEEKDEKEVINWYTGAVKRKEDTVSRVGINTLVLEY